MATTLAAFASGGAAAQTQPTTNNQSTLRDPVNEYPFPKQQQSWPGLVSRMTPRPDHGMGRAAAVAFAREGADVAINFLPQEEPDAREVEALIRGAGRKVALLPGDLRDEAFCAQLVSDAVNQLGGLDILVSNALRGRSRRILSST